MVANWRHYSFRRDWDGYRIVVVGDVIMMDTEKAVKQFYDNTPFPDFDLNKYGCKEHLRIRAGTFARILDRSMNKKKSVIDVGTGTGQLSAFLSLRRKCVWGIDFSDGSLNKAEKLKDKLKLNTLHLGKVDIINDDIFIESKFFDYVLCLGVLHHTSDPYKGFQNIVKLLEPNGYIAIGLYNRFGRIPLKLRKCYLRLPLNRNNKLSDRFIKSQLTDTTDTKKKNSWVQDQYFHPLESTHTVGEVLGWFKKNGIEYYKSVPSLTPFDNGDLTFSGVFCKYKDFYPYLPIRLYKQLTWILKTQREGGYWIMIGRKL